MTLSCDAAYSFIETMTIVAMSFLVVGLAAAFVIIGNYLLIKYLVDDLLGSKSPYPSDEKRRAPQGFTPVDVDNMGLPTGGGVDVNQMKKLYDMSWDGVDEEKPWIVEEEEEETVTLANGDIFS